MAKHDFTAPLPLLSELGAVHFIAIGGAGMSAVARIMHQRGITVSGCDAQETVEVGSLRAAGIDVSIGHDVAHLEGVSTVVVSSAIPETNLELSAARERGLTVLHRSQALAVVTRAARTVAVAGANGKTTTSALAASLLLDGGFDPSFALGGTLVSTGSNGRAGASDLMVVEADESDGSFVVYHPQVAVITNVQPDHLDFYGTFDGVKAAYREFVSTLVPGGTLVVCADDPGARELAQWARQQEYAVITFGCSADADARITAIYGEGMHSTATVQWQGASYPLSVPLPGAHNVLNATAAVVACAVIAGWEVPVALQTVSQFAGVGRRFESHGQADSVWIIDDYAHNPPKLQAVIAAARQVAGEGRVVVLFQPHLFSRTRDFAKEFAEALVGADVAIVMDVYPARETRFDDISGRTITSRIPAKAAVTVVDHPTSEGLVDEVLSHLRPGDVCLTVGAGDVTRFAPQLVHALQKRAHERSEGA